ncbi:MAG: hypothetical protein K6C94_05740 [Candidatus Gastranaerophilales bacterium]|nr:hypothetical protein [Candidatus Gastranaerophilales bacterium]
MKITFVLLAEILLTLLFLYFAAGHYNGTLSLTCPFNNQLYTFSYIKFAALAYLAGGITTVLIYMILDIADQRKLKAFKNEREKNKVAEAEKDSQIEALENKIKTLESALDNVLKNKDEE